MGNEIISKELLSEVLNLNMWKTETLTISTEYNKLYYNGITLGDYGYYEYTEHINIHELAHKCKEWALKQEYKVNSRPDNVPTLWEAYINLNITTAHTEVAATEPEAIFKACEWILQQKD